MTGSVGILVALAGIVCASASAQAQIVLEDPKRLAFDEDGGPLWFKSKSAKAMMSAAEFRRYNRALSSLDCPTAAWILNTAFIRTYPQYARGRLGPNCKRNLDCFYWSHYAGLYFDEYGFCDSVRSYRMWDQQLREKTPNPPKFALKFTVEERHYDDLLLGGRDTSLAVIIGKADSGYEPARKMIIRLLQQGDVFNAGAEAEYYLHQRACAEDSGCDASRDRIEELRAQIGAARSAEIDAIAAASKYQRPILDNLLLGEKLDFAAPKKRKRP